MTTSNQVRPETVVVTSGRPDAPGEPLNHPVAPASNFRSGGDRWYVRPDGTDTIAAFEQVVGDLEGGRAIAFGSGMAACAAALSVVPPGGTVAHVGDLYHGVGEMLSDASARGLLHPVPIDATDTAAWRAAIHEHDLVWIESPTNPLLELAELDTICAEAGRRARIVVDSTFATPLGQRPLGLGADVVIHSATKFIGGHSDLLAGVAVTDDATIHDRLVRHRLVHGALPGALEAFLALRGLRTLALRLARATESASALAQRLSVHPSVRRVRYPGLAGHPGHEAALRFMSGFGAVLSFELADDETADRFLDALGIIVHATSLGGVETTAERRSGYPGSAHVPPGLIRMSVGCEHLEDLWDDVAAALEVLR